jgi:L-ribulose-5-phosphate 3-epimerase
MHEIGFMQGRLSPQVDGKIQAFPWSHWESEFPAAERLSLTLMEWTLDQERLRENPLMTRDGQERIRALSARHGVAVRSVTGDCFMQAPFYKAQGSLRQELIEDLRAVLGACARVDARVLVVPLVDNGRVENDEQRQSLSDVLHAMTPELRRMRLCIAFELDFLPAVAKQFIESLPEDCFGINYDIGNSAALGYDPRAEIRAYGARIRNVHVKDRVLGGTTVPLGEGGADFPRVFSELARAGYRGDFVLQTARARDGDHAAALARYRGMTMRWLDRHAA